MKRLITTFSLLCTIVANSIATDINKCSVKEDHTDYVDITINSIKFTDNNDNIITIPSIINSLTKNMLEKSDEAFIESPAHITYIGNGQNSIAASNHFISIIIDATYLKGIQANALNAFSNITSVIINGTNTIPPTITETSFPSEWVSTCALTVPAEALETYKASEWVNYFYSINGEVIDHNPPTPTAISNTEADRLSVKSVGNVIILSEATNVKVFSVTGQQIFSGVTNNVTVNSNGIYIVKTANTTQKVIVK